MCQKVIFRRLTTSGKVFAGFADIEGQSMKWHFALLVASLLPFTVHAKVTSATLFPSHGQLVWEQSAALQQGSGELTLSGLSASLEDDTLMAKIQGLPGVLIQRVQVRQVEQAEVVADATRRLREELQAVEQAIGAREDEIRAWNQQVRLMTEATAVPGEATASELALLATTVQESTQQALTRIRAIRQTMADDLAERDRIKRELAATQQDLMATKTVTLVYRAEQAGQARVQLQYQTRSASWRSQYNARLETAESGTDGMLVLEHLALVRQTTGTDWKNVNLTLSNASAHLGTDIPALYPWLVTPGESPEARAKGAVQYSMDMMQSEALGAPQTAQIINDGTFTQSYQVESPVNLVSGNADQFVTVANHQIPVAVETRFFPAMDLNGFVHASGSYEAGIALPPGPVTLYRDGQSVGRSQLDGVSPGSDIDLGFGTNDRVVADLVNEQNQKGEQGVFKGEKYVRRVNRYDITNHHPQAVAVRVFDRLPVSRQDDLTVEELEITQPVQRNALDIKGVLSWERTVEPGESLTLKSGFELRVPEDSELPQEFR